MNEEEQNEDLGGQLLGRLHRPPRAAVDVEPPAIEKGLTPSGVGVVVTAGVVLMAFPCLFVVSCGSLAATGMVSTIPVRPASSAPPHVRPVVLKSFKRVGKDVKLTVTVDNTASKINWSAIFVRVRLDGNGPIKPAASFGAVLPGTKKTYTCTYANVRKTKMKIEIITDYKSTQGSGSRFDTESKSIP